MAITTMAGALAGLRPPIDITKSTQTLVNGRWNTSLYTGGFPPIAAAPSSGLGGEVLTSMLGQIPFTNPASGNTYLARMEGMLHSTNSGTILLCDRLWQNSGIDVTSTAEQVFTGASQIPSRDSDGSNSGFGVLAALECTSLLGGSGATATLKYTNQAGTTGRTAITVQDPIGGSTIVGNVYVFGLASGDTGIRKAESITLSATLTSGAVSVVLFRIIARMEVKCVDQNVVNSLDAFSLCMPRIYNDSVLYLMHICGVASTGLQAAVTFTQG